MPRIRVPAKGPEIIGLYYTVPRDALTDDDVRRMRTDFALAAHDQYLPMIKLVIPDRTDFVGKTAEDVFAPLEQEKRDDPMNDRNFPSVHSILLVTEDTVRSAHTAGEEIEVVYVQRWAHLSDFGQTLKGEYLANDDAREPRKSDDASKDPDLRFTLKMRIEMQYAPVLYANLDICNITIPEMLQLPYDPALPLAPPVKQDLDWRTQPPYPATVVASPTSYERQERGPAGMLLLGARHQPQESYRLTEQASEQLGVVPQWTAAWHDAREAEGTMTLSQPWKPRPLAPF